MDVDLDALASNYRLLARLAAPSRCGATVKADAYGLGLEPVVRCLWATGCRSFFVANVEEALQLRRVLAQAQVFVFNGVRGEEAPALVGHALVPVLNSVEQVEAWRRQASIPGRDAPLPCALHLDTGMNRLGLGAEDLDRLLARSDWREGLDLQLLMTHLATAHRHDDHFTRRQLALFQHMRRALPTLNTSIGNSAGTLLGAATRGHLVRPGLALYGINPFREAPAHPALREVVRVYGRIVQHRVVGLQGSVGYGADYSAAPGTRLATVGVGYADGYRRVLGNSAEAAVGGVRVPVVGRVSMDLLTLDVSRVPAQTLARANDTVTLMGGEVPVETLASQASTIPYELLTGLGPRLPRRYLAGEGRKAPWDPAGG